MASSSTNAAENAGRAARQSGGVGSSNHNQADAIRKAYDKGYKG